MRRIRHFVVPSLAASALAMSLTMAAPPRPAGASSAGSIAALASANLNKHACSRNSLGGRGFTASCTGDNGKPEYWCADFARWVWAHSGVEDIDEVSSAAGSFYTYGLENGTLSGFPAVGDAAVFNYYGGGEAEHVAIVTAVYPNGTIETTSGDWGGTGSSETKFASTATVALNGPEYPGLPGTVPDTMGMTLSAFVAPVGVAVKPVVAATTAGAATTLGAGEAITSPNGLFSLHVSPSGALQEVAGGRAIWSNGSSVETGDRAVMQRDGNLVLYSPLGKALWATHTNGHPGSTFSVKDNGKLVVSDAKGVLWSRSPYTGRLLSGDVLVSGEKLISNGGLFTLDMQKDGNLVEYTAGRPIWTSHTSGNPRAETIMQPDGDLEILSATGSVLWSTHTTADAGASTRLLAEGALVISTPAGMRPWKN